MRIWDVEIWVKDKKNVDSEKWAIYTVVADTLDDAVKKAVAYEQGWKYVEAQKAELVREVDVP